MSYLKTNTNKGDASERTKNLENITIMGAVNKSLNTTNQNLKINVATFKDNKLQSTNNHTNLLKITHGYFDLEPCCDLIKQKATSLEDGLQTQINANTRVTIAQSSCNRQPLFSSNDCNTPNKNMRPNVLKDNFNYPIPIQKNSCCDSNRIQPKIKINSTKTHTKYLPIMSKIKKMNYNQSQSFDPVSYPNFNIVNKNNLVGYFNNDVFKVKSYCSTKTTSKNCSHSTTNVGHKLKYQNYNESTNCGCADYDDYIIKTSTLDEPTPITLNNDASFFSRKWSSSKNC